MMLSQLIAGLLRIHRFICGLLEIYFGAARSSKNATQIICPHIIAIHIHKERVVRVRLPVENYGPFMCGLLFDLFNIVSIEERRQNLS